MINDNVLAELAVTISTDATAYYYEYNGKPFLQTNRTYLRKGAALNQVNIFFVSIFEMCHVYENNLNDNNYWINRYIQKYGDNHFLALCEYIKNELEVDLTTEKDVWKLRGQFKKKAKELVQRLIQQGILTLKEIK